MTDDELSALAMRVQSGSAMARLTMDEAKTAIRLTLDAAADPEAIAAAGKELTEARAKRARENEARRLGRPVKP